MTAQRLHLDEQAQGHAAAQNQLAVHAHNLTAKAHAHANAQAQAQAQAQQAAEEACRLDAAAQQLQAEAHMVGAASQQAVALLTQGAAMPPLSLMPPTQQQHHSEAALQHRAACAPPAGGGSLAHAAAVPTLPQPMHDALLGVPDDDGMQQHEHHIVDELLDDGQLALAAAEFRAEEQQHSAGGAAAHSQPPSSDGRAASSLSDGHQQLPALQNLPLQRQASSVGGLYRPMSRQNSSVVEHASAAYLGTQRAYVKLELGMQQGQLCHQGSSTLYTQGSLHSAMHDFPQGVPAGTQEPHLEPHLPTEEVRVWHGTHPEHLPLRGLRAEGLQCMISFPRFAWPGGWHPGHGYSQCIGCFCYAV